MNCMKKLVVTLIVMLAFAVNADAQGILGRLKDRAVNAAKNAVERKVEDKVSRETNDAMDNVLDGKKKSKNAGDDGDAEAVDDYQNDTKNVKNDFVRGSVVMFEDDFANEQVGEFPSKWDLVRGNAEVASVNGAKCIEMDQRDSWIAPLVKGGIKNYLGDVFTIEYDMLYDDRPKDGCSNIELDIMHEDSPRDHELFTITYGFCNDKQSYHCDYCLT